MELQILKLLITRKKKHFFSFFIHFFLYLYEMLDIN